MTEALGRRVAAEALGSLLLATSVIGSGIMGERLAAGNAAIALLAWSVRRSTRMVSGGCALPRAKLS